ncbi:hypothetical protein [Mesoterricola silvestris]|nr:hypothetical protein [Mesoterricola silvestris]
MRVGPGELYLVPAPTADPGTDTASRVDGYYALFYGSAGKASKKVLTNGLVPWANLTSGGLNLKITSSTVEFKPNTSPKKKLKTGIEEATAEFEYYDVDPAHLVDTYGSNVLDLITVEAASGIAARKIALIGSDVSNKEYVALFRVPHPELDGEFWHHLMPSVTTIGDLDLKNGKDDPIQAKFSLQLGSSRWLKNAANRGVVLISDDPTAPATA